MKLNKLKNFFFYFFIGVSLSVSSQNKFVLTLFEGEKENVIKLNDLTEVQKELDKVTHYYLNKGFLEVRLDSLIKQKGSSQAYFCIGNKYKWGTFSFDEKSDISFLKKTFVNLEQKNVNVERFIELREKSVTEANNKGYPYAKFYLYDLSVNNDSLKAKLNFELGTKVFFDELVVEGDVVSKGFLQAYLNIKPKQSFSKEKINKIPYLLAKLKGLRLVEAVNVQFYKNICLVKLKLKKKPDDKIDALIGFQTNSVQKSEVVGNVNLSLNNLFKSSKKIQLNWQKPTQLNQQLNLKLDYPNAFLTSVGLDGGLELFKRDTSFLNVSYQMGLYYELYEQKIGLNVERIVSSLFKDNLKSDSLRSYKSVKTTIKYELNKLTGEEMRQKGYLFISGIGVQQLLITDSIKIIPTTTLHFSFDGNLPISSYLTYRQLVSGFAILAEDVFVNQMKPVGGYNSIRGFNQNQFFTERYLAFSSSLVFHLGTKANLSTFSDYGFLLTSNGNEKLVSVGLGIDIKSDNTVLNFAYALGQSDSQKFSLVLSKIHVGIATKF